MVTIKLKEREIPLLFSAEELRVMQLEIGPTNKAISLVLGRNPDNKDDDSKFGSPEHLEAAATMIRILGNAGLEESGKEPDLTDKMIMRAIKPTELADVVNACIDAIGEGMDDGTQAEPGTAGSPVSGSGRTGNN